MTYIAYFDCFSGCSGDMILGALLDAGLDIEALKKELSGLGLDGYDLSVEKVVRSSIAATKFYVILDGHDDVLDLGQEQDHGLFHDHSNGHEHSHSKNQGHVHTRKHEHSHPHHRGLTEILDIIRSGRISPEVKKKSSAIFKRLGEVEAGIHGISIDQVHFHELGAVDTIVDIVGTIFAFESLNIEKAYSSALPFSSGTVSTAHGILPALAPATLKLLADAHAPMVPAPSSSTPSGELITPTGAVLITSLASFQQPAFRVEKVGYGAGTRQFKEWPNILRISIGEETPGFGSSIANEWTA